MPFFPVQRAAVLAILLVAGCGFGGGDRQEVIDKLRTLGVTANPPLTEPSVAGQAPKTVELTIFAAMPLGQTATLTAFKDSAGASNGALILQESEITILPDPAVYTDYNGIRIYSAKARITIPIAAAFGKGAALPVLGAQLRYGLKIIGPSNSEQVIADIPVYPTGAPELKWQTPSIAITQPVDGATVAIKGGVDVKATVTNPTNEPIKIGWFVTAGQIANRRAAETSWSVKAQGTQTILVTIHGLNTRGFALKAITVTGN